MCGSVPYLSAAALTAADCITISFCVGFAPKTTLPSVFNAISTIASIAIRCSSGETGTGDGSASARGVGAAARAAFAAAVPRFNCEGFRLVVFFGVVFLVGVTCSSVGTVNRSCFSDAVFGTGWTLGFRSTFRRAVIFFYPPHKERRQHRSFRFRFRFRLLRPRLLLRRFVRQSIRYLLICVVVLGKGGSPVFVRPRSAIEALETIRFRSTTLAFHFPSRRMAAGAPPHDNHNNHR